MQSGHTQHETPFTRLLRDPTAKLFASVTASLVGGSLGSIAVFVPAFGWSSLAEGLGFALKYGLLTGLACGIPLGIVFALIRRLTLVSASLLAGLGAALVSAIYFFNVIGPMFA